MLKESMNLADGKHKEIDLLLLAMAHHRLGHKAEARMSFRAAVAQLHEPSQRPAAEAGELKAFLDEAESVLADISHDLPDDVFGSPGPDVRTRAHRR